MEAAYIGVKLWVNTIRSMDTTDLKLVKTILAHQTLLAPEGIVAVDYATGHLWKTPLIGKARPDGQFDIVWKAPQPVRPAPFPFYRSQVEWLDEQKALTEAQP